MRLNEPNTDREIILNDNTLIVSKTDTGGRITFVNQAFVDVSGYGEEELIGSPHNILRHPHMPAGAFADLWSTIKSGRPWEGIVKNRTKNGDFYWVHANATPLIEDGVIVGYISIRTKPAREAVAAADKLYADIREGRAAGVQLREGVVRNSGVMPMMRRFIQSVRGRIVIHSGLLVGGAGVAGVLGLDNPLGIVVFVFGLMFSVVTARWLMNYIQAPLVRLENHFAAMAVGNLHHDIPQENTQEFIAANAMLRTMRARLAFSIEERAEINRRAEAVFRREMLALTEVLEGEVQETVGDVSIQSSRLGEGAATLLKVASELNNIASMVSQSMITTSGNVETVASATAELEASSREILSQVAHSSRLAEVARQRADDASQKVGGLTEAATQIGGVVGMIHNIAGQTRMLALNATIEAARAGEAGKGFAVVAEEVKGLARQTEEGISNVNTHADRIASTTNDTVETVAMVVDTIRDIDTVGGEVAKAADEQRAATAEIMQSAAQAANHTHLVAENVRTMMSAAEETNVIAQRVSDLSSLVNRDISTLQRRLNIILRTSCGGDRRRYGRYPVALRFTAEFGGEKCNGFTGDISENGALLVLAGQKVPTVTTGAIELENVGRFSVRILSESMVGLHIRFDGINEHQEAALIKEIERASEADRDYIVVAQGVATKVMHAWEGALTNREIDKNDLFDANYDLIPRTDPQQVLAPHTELAERLLRPHIEEPLGRDSKIVFCCVTDRNGYIAAHNAQYSHPQRQDDPLWNAANSRNRRIFEDRTSILASRNIKPALTQTYARDLGGNRFMLLKEIDAPITVGGQHWGAVRLALQLS